jgi:hypothetical protein
MFEGRTGFFQASKGVRRSLALGARQMHDRTFVGACLAAAFLACSHPGLAASPIGDATQIVRQVSGTVGGRTRSISPNDEIFQDETIRTQPESSARLRFLDKTDLSIGASAAVKLDRFVYDPGGSARSVVVSSTKGVLRWVSGGSPSSAYEIRTPQAVLGIRGTSFDLIVAPRDTVVVLLQGVVSVCARLGPRNCEVLTVPGSVALANASGVQGPLSAAAQSIDLPAAYAQYGGASILAATPAVTSAPASGSLFGFGKAPPR